MKKALYAGSFDPLTLGHEDLIRRSLKICDELFIVIADNVRKQHLFTAEERKALLEEAFPDARVKVFIYHGLILDFAKEHGISVMIRGVRSITDFSFEMEYSMINRRLDPSIEMVFLPSSQEFLDVSSSNVKEIAAFHGDFSTLVNPSVAEAIKRKNVF